jgi:hypothetical protein
MISMIAAALRRAVQRLMSSDGWFIEALLSGCNSALGYPPQTPASCRQLDRAGCGLAIVKSTRQGGFFAYWLSNFCGGRSKLTCPSFPGDAPLGGQVSSFSFHRSDFGGDLPLSDQLKFQQSTGSVLRDHFTLALALVSCFLVSHFRRT